MKIATEIASLLGIAQTKILRMSDNKKTALDCDQDAGKHKEISHREENLL